VTGKNQAAEIRKKLRIQGGDTSAFEVGDELGLRYATPLDIQYAQALADTLSEWNSDNDAEAY